MSNHYRANCFKNCHDRYYDCSSEHDMRPRNSRRNNQQRSANVLQTLGDLREFYDQLQNFADLTHEIFRQYSNNRHCNCQHTVNFPQKNNNKPCCHYNCQHRRKSSTERKHPPQIHYDREESRPSGSHQRHSSEQYNDRSICSCASNRTQLPKPSNHSSMCMIENSDYSKCKRKSFSENQGTCGANSSMKEHCNKCSQYPEKSKKCGRLFHGNNNCSDSQRNNSVKQRETNDNESCTCDYCQCMPDVYNRNNIFMDLGSDDESDDGDSMEYLFKAIRLEPVQILLQDGLETENGCTSDKNTQTFMQDANESTGNNCMINKGVQTESVDKYDNKFFAESTKTTSDQFDNEQPIPEITSTTTSEPNVQTARNSSEPNISSPKESKRKISQSGSFSEKEQNQNNANNGDENNPISKSKPIQVGSIEESFKVESIQDIHKESPEFEKKSPNVENNQSRDKKESRHETDSTNRSADVSKQNNINKEDVETKPVSERNTKESTDIENIETGNTRRSVDKENDKTRPEGGRNAREFSDIEINQIKGKESLGYENGSTQRSADNNKLSAIDKEDVERIPASGGNANNFFHIENSQIRDKEKSRYERRNARRSVDGSKVNNIDKDVETRPKGGKNVREFFDIENNLIRDKEESRHETESTHRFVNRSKQSNMDNEDVEVKLLNYASGSSNRSADRNKQNFVGEEDVETKPANERNANNFFGIENNQIREKEKSVDKSKNAHHSVDGSTQKNIDKENVETKSGGSNRKKFSGIFNVNQIIFNKIKNKEKPTYETGDSHRSEDRSQQNNMDKEDVETKPDFENNLIKDKEKSYPESRNARCSVDRSQQNDIDKVDFPTKLAGRTVTKELANAVDIQFQDNEKFSNKTGNSHNSDDGRKQPEIINDNTKPKDIENNQLRNIKLLDIETENTRPSFEKKPQIDIHKETIQTGRTNTKDSSSIENCKIGSNEEPNHKAEVVPSCSNRNILKLMGEKIYKIVIDKNRRPEETSADKNTEVVDNDKPDSRRSIKQLPVIKKNQNENEKPYKKHTTGIKQKPDVSDQASRPTNIEPKSELSFSNDEDVEMVDKIVQTSSYRNLTLEDLEIQTSNTLLEGLVDIQNNKSVPKKSSNESTTESHNLKKTNRNNKK